MRNDDGFGLEWTEIEARYDSGESHGGWNPFLCFLAGSVSTIAFLAVIVVAVVMMGAWW